MSEKQTGPLATIAKWFKRASSSLREKETVESDDFGLEHLLLYHGLVGSTPENQRDLKDVRADIGQAIKDKSAPNLAIALKLEPLFWQEKLAKLFAELDREEMKTALDLLNVSRKDDSEESFDMLLHEDWRVRSNAAYLLAENNVQSADARIAASLRLSTTTVKRAFCHLAYALGKLGGKGGDDGRIALEENLFHDEPWFQVDAAGALSMFPERIGAKLAKLIFSNNELYDYIAVVVSKNKKPLELLKSPEEDSLDQACALLIGLTAAAQGTFSSDAIFDTSINQCFELIDKRARANPKPLTLRAARQLALWLPIKDGKQEASTSLFLADLSSGELSDKAKEMLRQTLGQPNQGKDDFQFRHAIALAGELELSEFNQLFITLLETKDSSYITELINALAHFGDPKSAKPLRELAQSLVNIDERTSAAISKQPVVEVDAKSARTYWLILRALGSLPNKTPDPLLLKAQTDFAPDKREQAVASLVSQLVKAHARQDAGLKLAVPEEVSKAVRGALDDPSPHVKLQALIGIGDLQLVELIETCLRFLDAQEISLNRQTFASLKKLCDAGHKAIVVPQVTAKAKSEGNPYKRKRIEAFLQTL